MKIDKLGFYKSKDGNEIEIVFIDKFGEYEFIAIGKLYMKEINSVNFYTYRSDDGECEDDSDNNLIEFLRPSGVDWPVPRKTSFVAYLDENCKDHFNPLGPDCVMLGMHIAKPDNPPGKHYRKISKWRFYAEEVLGGEND